MEGFEVSIGAYTDLVSLPNPGLWLGMLSYLMTGLRTRIWRTESFDRTIYW